MEQKTETYIDRLFQERQEFEARHKKLVDFIMGPDFEKTVPDAGERMRIRQQRYYMGECLAVLNQRLAFAVKAKEEEKGKNND